jgi:serine acetyltransferase
MLTTTAAHSDFIRSEEGLLLREDVLCWGEWYGVGGFFVENAPHIEPDSPDYLVLMLDKLFVTFAEFRSLFDYRLSAAPNLKYHMLDKFRRATELHINCPMIGPRFRIQHGHNTYVFAREVGSDFWVNHNVTIGANRGIPKIGNCVSVRTGAVVVGEITIGDDVMIGANAVVTTDIPDGHAAYAPRTLIKPVRQKGRCRSGASGTGTR